MKAHSYIPLAIVLFLFSCSLPTYAQVCTGALGDPAVNIDFGSGPNPGPAVKSATTTYIFDATSCPNDGFYTLANSTYRCFNDSWHSIPEDHTPGDVDGYMMLVNASLLPGDFYVDTVNNLCANTTYEFAAWMSSILLPSACGGVGYLPNLVFNIESVTGAVLGTYTTGNIPTSELPTWKQYGLFFTTPANTTSVVLRITSITRGGCGNDVAIDDITFRPCGPTVSTSLVNATQNVLDVCFDSRPEVTITGVVGSGFNSPALQWQESIDGGLTWKDLVGESSPVYHFSETGVERYSYRLSVAEAGNISEPGCRIASEPVTVVVHPNPVAVAEVNSPVCESSLVQFSAGGAVNFDWSGPAGFVSHQASPAFPATQVTAGNYTLIAYDRFGCKDTTTVLLEIVPKPVVSVNGNRFVFCEGDSVQLQARGGNAYLWSPALGLSANNIYNPTAQPKDSVEYQVVGVSDNGCTDTAIVAIDVLKRPIANAGPDRAILLGQSLVLAGVSSGTQVQHSWSPATYLNNTILVQPTARPLKDTRYTLTVVSQVGCGTASDDVLVQVYDQVYVPTAFSPNNDGLNDRWRIQALFAIPTAKVYVYDRFGHIVFETTGANRQWDGSFKGAPLPAGTYAYLIDLRDGKPLLKGTVTIVR